MELIRCPRCAREIPDSSKFCRRCGCAIAWRRQPAAAVSSATAWGPPAVAQSKPSPSKPVAARTPDAAQRSGGAGVFAIFAAAGLFFFVNYHVAVRPVMSPAMPSVAPSPYTPPPIMLRSSGFRSASNVLPPPAPPGTTMWLEEPEPGVWDTYDRARRASQYTYPPPAKRRH